ncbi:MAG: hypothetical protein Fur009_2010 [Candidatus Microgenomates bacterium]
MRKFFLTFILFLFFIFFASFNVNAADYKVDYEVDYDLRNFETTQLTKVNFHIKITNLKSDVYVSRFSIAFPSSFYISYIIASDDFSTISPNISQNSDYTKIDLAFSNPNTGKESINNFYLRFNQKNLFKINGKVWEVILPTIEKKGVDTYKIKVILPENTDKKISIAKPKPDLINNQEIIWNNPSAKTIYAVFGDRQLYKTQLIYNLKNPQVYPVRQEIAFPPDTLYQKIYLSSINPAPNYVYQDEDGNYLGLYFLKPFETKKIIFNGYIEIFAKPREELKNSQRELLNKQKKYLLSEQPYWSIKSLDKIENLKTVNDIYYFVVNNLQYSYDKLKSDNQRLGAEKILQNPSYAVCLEFTDLFVSIAREKGILAREINGYGYSLDSKLQPISLFSDVLHAWPEYYDEDLGIWKSVDPTWENTSGIDYFTTFDLNHITFAIHGKSSEYPLAAGNYKITNSKDIILNPTIENINEIKKIVINNFDFFKNKNDNYQIKFSLKNESNVYLYNLPINIKIENFKLNNNEFFVSTLAPFEIKEFVTDLKYQGNFSLKNNYKTVLIFINNEKIFEKNIKIDFFSDIVYKAIFFIIILVLILIFFIKRYKK